MKLIDFTDHFKLKQRRINRRQPFLSSPSSVFRRIYNTKYNGQWYLNGDNVQYIEPFEQPSERIWKFKK